MWDENDSSIVLPVCCLNDVLCCFHEPFLRQHSPIVRNSEQVFLFDITDLFERFDNLMKVMGVFLEYRLRSDDVHPRRSADVRNAQLDAGRGHERPATHPRRQHRTHTRPALRQLHAWAHATKDSNNTHTNNQTMMMMIMMIIKLYNVPICNPDSFPIHPKES